MRDKEQKKGRTWLEAARMVLEKHKNAPMSQKDILNFIQKDKLKEISGVNYPLNVLGAMLYSNARTTSGIFYKVPGKLGVYKLKKSAPRKKKTPRSKKSNKCGGSQGAKGVNNSKCNAATPGRESGSQGAHALERASQATINTRARTMIKRRVSSRLALRRSLAQSGGAVPSASPGRPVSVSQQHSRKALKQALKRQQQQTQRRGVVVSAGTLMSRLILRSCATSEHTPPPSSNGKVEQNNSNSHQAPVLAQTASLAIKRRLPARPDRLDAGEFKRGKDAGMDVESPDSVLVNIDLKALINRHTFSALPGSSQRALLSLLPLGDGQATENGVSLKSTALNNEFFNFAAAEWTERLGEGEFTPEMQLRMRQEQEKAKPVEQWKERFFENYYGEKSGLTKEESRQLVEGHCEFYFSPKHDASSPNNETPNGSDEKPGRRSATKTEIYAANSALPLWKALGFVKEPPWMVGGPLVAWLQKLWQEQPPPPLNGRSLRRTSERRSEAKNDCKSSIATAPLGKLSACDEARPARSPARRKRTSEAPASGESTRSHTKVRLTRSSALAEEADRKLAQPPLARTAEGFTPGNNRTPGFVKRSRDSPASVVPAQNHLVALMSPHESLHSAHGRPHPALIREASEAQAPAHSVISCHDGKRSIMSSESSGSSSSTLDMAARRPDPQCEKDRVQQKLQQQQQQQLQQLHMQQLQQLHQQQLQQQQQHLQQQQQPPQPARRARKQRMDAQRQLKDLDAQEDGEVRLEDGEVEEGRRRIINKIWQGLQGTWQHPLPLQQTLLLPPVPPPPPPPPPPPQNLQQKQNYLVLLEHNYCRPAS